MLEEPPYRKTPNVADLMRKRAADEAARAADEAARKAALRIVERWNAERSPLWLVPDDPMRHRRRNAVAWRLLPRLPDESRDRYPHA
jgi:hypothetical protein